LAGRTIYHAEIEIQREPNCIHFGPGNEGAPIGEVCRKTGISEATFYNWRAKNGGLLPLEMKRLRQLEGENAKLKKLVAGLSRTKATLQDVVRRKI
jgi:putative transposase